MSAGTVISGGFPGRIAQEVQPNPKCRGCMHYVDSAGRTGACSIGLRPWLCGDGQAQDIGYAPITAGAGAYLPDMTVHASRAHETQPQDTAALYGAGSTRPVQFTQISLGEEHVHLIKSMVERHTEMEQTMCRLCKSMGTTIGTAPANVAPQVCTCQPIEARTIAKSLMSQLSNRERSRITFDDAVAFVYGVAEAGFTLPIEKGSKTATEVRSPTSTKTRTATEVRSPTSTSTDAYTQGNVTVTGGAGSGDTHVHLHGHRPKQSRRADEEAHVARSRGAAKRPEKMMRETGASVAKAIENLQGAVADIEKADMQPHTAHFKAPHGKYKVESNHSTGEHTVHYTPTNHEHAPAQSVRVESHEHAVKLAKVHAFVNDHGGEHTHATLHHDHVAVHEPQGGHDGGAAVHKVSSMKQARDHLGY